VPGDLSRPRPNDRRAGPAVRGDPPIATERDQERAELAEERKLTYNLRLDLRAAKDRLAEHETLRRNQAQRIAELERAANVTPLRSVDRYHNGPPGRCHCGIVHGSGQSIALNAPLAGS
jgi:hypothetical protein